LSVYVFFILNNNIKGTGTGAPVLGIFTLVPSFNITDCNFFNVSYPSSVGGLDYTMDSSSNGKYSFTGSTFINFTGAHGCIYFEMAFTNFNFSNNSFSNMSVTNYGGVYFYFCSFHLFYLFSLFDLINFFLIFVLFIYFFFFDYFF
jgi:hypothetical protein